MGLCNLPSKNGKGDPSWQYDNRISGASLTSFSSVVLNVVLILYLFVEKILLHGSSPEGCRSVCALVVHDHGGCWHLVRTGSLIIALSFGRTCLLFMPHMTIASQKLHHMHHVVDGMQLMGKLLSCFFVRAEVSPGE